MAQFKGTFVRSLSLVTACLLIAAPAAGKPVRVQEARPTGPVVQGSQITAELGWLSITSKAVGTMITLHGPKDYKRSFKLPKGKPWLEQVPPGRYRWYVNSPIKPLGLYGRFEVLVDETVHVEVRLPKPASLSVAGSPKDLKIVVEGPFLGVLGRSLAKHTLAIGGTLTNLPLGLYEVRVSKNGFAPQTQQLSLKDGSHHNLNFELKPHGSLNVTGHPRGARVVITGANGFRIERGLPVSIQNMPSGDYQIEVNRKGYFKKSVVRKIRAGHHDKVVVDLQKNQGINRRFRWFPAVTVLAHQGAINSIRWHQDGLQILTASSDATARVWQVRKKEDQVTEARLVDGLIKNKMSIRNEEVRNLADRHSRYNANYRLITEPESVELDGHSSIIHSANWSPDGRRIVTASHDETVRVWRQQGKWESRVLKGHTNSVGDAQWSPNGQLILSASDDGHFRVFPADDANAKLTFKTGRFAGVVAQGVHWSPSGQKIATALSNNRARIYQADGEGEVIDLIGHDQFVTSAQWSPDGKQLVTTSYDDTVRIWSDDGRAKPIILKGHAAGVETARWSPDGRYILTASLDGTARVWRSDRVVKPLILEHKNRELRSADWSPNGELIATASSDGTFHIWVPEVGISRIKIKGEMGFEEGFHRKKIKGPLAWREIIRVLRRHRNQIKGCYEDELRWMPNPQVKMMTRMEITKKSGRVTSALIIEDTLAHKPFNSCVTKVWELMRFPPKEANTVVDVEWVFDLEWRQFPFWDFRNWRDQVEWID